MDLELPFVLLDDGLPAPRPPARLDAGIDLHARTTVTLSAATGPVTVGTGIAVAIPAGWVGLVCPRSGLAARHGVSVLNGPGVVDSGYRGEIQVILFSAAAREITLERGSRIAQLVLTPHAHPALLAVDRLAPTQRGERGLGSSGIA